MPTVRLVIGVGREMGCMKEGKPANQENKIRKRSTGSSPASGRVYDCREATVRWDLFRDLADLDCYLETFVVVSWAEHLRQHARVTVADQATEARAFAFLQEGVEPVAAHLIAARAYDRRIPAEPPHAELS